jgi:tRNA A37 threonylcarbamoyladenosine modification protein TsaB
MEISIEIKNKKIKVYLRSGKKEMDSFNINEEYSLSENLLPGIDKLLRKNKIKREDIEKITVDSDQSESFMTTRIAKSVAGAWNYAVKSNCSN